MINESYDIEMEQKYIEDLERKNREMFHILDKIKEIQNRKLSILYKDSRYILADEKGELVSDLDIIGAIQKV